MFRLYLNKLIATLVAITCLAIPYHVHAEPALTKFLIVPQPDCGMNVVYQSEFFDSLRCRPGVYLPSVRSQLQRALAKGNVFTVTQLRRDIATIYTQLDSTDAAEASLNTALQEMKAAYAKKPSGAMALVIARIFDQDKGDGWSDSAATWYLRTVKIDPDNWHAYFEYTEGLPVFTSDTMPIISWLDRCDSVYLAATRSTNDPSSLAEINYCYAKVLSSLHFEQMVLGMFTTMPKMVAKMSSGTDKDSAGAALAREYFGGFSNPRVVELYQRAAQLDPGNAPYLLTYSFAKLFQIFVNTISRTPDIGSLATEETARTLFSQSRDTIMIIRQDLNRLPESEKLRYPAVYYYLAAADLMLDNVQAAYDEVRMFISRMPSASCGYGLHCGICGMLIKEGANDASTLLPEMMALSGDKCNRYPTPEDCYRLGYLKLMTGDPAGADSAIDVAITHSDKQDLNYIVARATCAYLQGNRLRLNSLLALLRAKEHDMAGDCLAAYTMLQAVITAGDGDIPSAIRWATKSAKADSTNALTIEFLQLFNNAK